MRKLAILVLVVGSASALAVRGLLPESRSTTTEKVPQQPLAALPAAPAKSSGSSPPFNAALAARAARGSHIVGTYLDGIVETQESRCIVLTPKRSETPTPPNPDLRVVAGDGTYASAREWFDALGRLRLGKGPGKLSVPVRLETHWNNLLSLSRGPVSTPPLRVLIKHYPRPELPGRCYVVHATAYTAEDPYLDRPQAFDQVRGVIFDLRKTYQLEGGEARLIEAQIEVQVELRYGEGKADFGHLLNREELGPIARDSGWSGHFEKFAGGTRFGMIWLDVSCGMGDAAGWSRGYRISTKRGERHSVETEPLTPEQVKTLLEFVGRS